MKTTSLNPVITICTFVLLLTSIILAACTPATPVADPLVNSPTPEIFIPLDPSPTSDVSDLPLPCQVTDLKVHVDKAAGYCFAYPQRFKVNDQPTNLPLLQGPAVDGSGDVKANLMIEVAPSPANKSLDQQVDEFLQGFTVINPAQFEHARVTVGGESAILVERARVDEVPTQMNWRIVFVPHAGFLYRLIYRPVDVVEAKADLDELFQVTTGSFTFLYVDSSSNLPEATTTPVATSIPPVVFSTPVPTSIPSTPTAKTPCDWALFITDVTVPDGTVFAPSTYFVKTWRLKNIGTCTWTPSYSLVFVSGDQMGGPSAVSLPGNVVPGATVDVSVSLIAPASFKSFTGNWMLRNASGTLFGLGPSASGIFLVNINVACQVINLRAYVDNTNGYCFAYPPRFAINNQPSSLPLVQGPAVDSSGQVYANLTVEVASSNGNKSLNQQVDEFLLGFTTIDPAQFEHVVMTVGGEPAILVEKARVNEVPTQMNWRIVFIEHTGKFYRLIYRPVDVPAATSDLDELFQVTTSSFTFIK